MHYIAFLNYGDLPKNGKNEKYPASYPAICHECETEEEAITKYPDHRIMSRDKFLGYQEAMQIAYANAVNKVNSPRPWYKFW